MSVVSVMTRCMCVELCVTHVGVTFFRGRGRCGINYTLQPSAVCAQAALTLRDCNSPNVLSAASSLPTFAVPCV